MRAPFIVSLAFAALTGFPVIASAVETPVTITPSQAVQASTQASSESGSVNLNTADASTLQDGLVGIGAVKAQAIVQYRDNHGPFASIEELLEVKGIGAATLEKNRDRLSLK